MGESCDSISANKNPPADLNSNHQETEGFFNVLLDLSLELLGPTN